jgi:N-methylhydantoinase B/oxoprolinase/acetone carboxylase alpha subunit
MSSRQEQAESDTGGAVRFRGGMAIEREWTLLEGKADLLIRSDRRDHLPYGLSGGQSGSSSVLHATDGSKTILPVMVSTRIKKTNVSITGNPALAVTAAPFLVTQRRSPGMSGMTACRPKPHVRSMAWW